MDAGADGALSALGAAVQATTATRVAHRALRGGRKHVRAGRQMVSVPGEIGGQKAQDVIVGARWTGVNNRSEVWLGDLKVKLY